MTRFCYGVEHYNDAGRGECWELWHPGVTQSPHCGLKLNHKGDHEGNGMVWSKEPAVDAETAAKFLSYYRRIPNPNHAIVLNDDGSVTMTLSALRAATQFIDVRYSD